MKNLIGTILCALAVTIGTSAAWAAGYADAEQGFRDAGQSAEFFEDSYGYALFPNIGKGGIVVGAAYGEGRVYEQGTYVGDTSVTQITAGIQLGGQVYSMVIFFEDKRALDEFTSGNFEFSAEAGAVALTAGASAKATTAGTTAGASATEHHATTTSTGYYKGMAIFTIPKGGLMYEATLGGQKFSYTPL